MTNVIVAKDKVFLITGGANGIGAGLVEAFLKDDCEHVAFLDINESVGKEFEKKLHEAFGNKKSQFIKCDITNEAELDDAFDKVIKQFKYIDVVINNAGVMNDAKHIYRKEIELNVHVAFLDINESVGKEFEKKLHEAFGNKKSQFIKCDITNEAELDDAFDKVIKQFKYIDVVINNAGVMNDAKHIYRKEIELNVTALVTITFKAIDLMRKDHGGKGGTIINLSSVVALLQNHVFPVYFGTKSAVLQFSNCIGMEPQYLRTGVRVTTVCFGKTDTALIPNAQSFDEETSAEVQEFMDAFPFQKTQSAVNGVVEAFKKGKSGSTWISIGDRPAKDITAKIKQAYAIMESTLYEE